MKHVGQHQSMTGTALAPAHNKILNEAGDWSQQTLPRDKWLHGTSRKYKRSACIVKEIPKWMTVWSQKEKMYDSEVHCGITTNHRNSKQLKLFILIYLLISRLSLNACLRDWLQNERSFAFTLKKQCLLVQVLQWQILRMTRPIYKIWIVHFASIALLSLQWTPIQNLTNVLFYSPLVYTLGFEILMHFCYCKDIEGRHNLLSEPAAPKEIIETFKVR